jgi:hypothetical protein
LHSTSTSTCARIVQPIDVPRRAVAKWASRAVPTLTSSTSCQCLGTGSISPKGPKTSPAHRVRKACCIAVEPQRWPRGVYHLLEGVSTPRRYRGRAPSCWARSTRVRIRLTRSLSRMLLPRYPSCYQRTRTFISPHPHRMYSTTPGEFVFPFELSPDGLAQQNRWVDLNYGFGLDLDPIDPDPGWGWVPTQVVHNLPGEGEGQGVGDAMESAQRGGAAGDGGETREFPDLFDWPSSI